MHAEKVLTQFRLAVKLVPIPREFSNHFGLALRFEWGHVDQVRAALGESDVEVAEVHHLG